jgi:hypothetical protein
MQAQWSIRSSVRNTEPRRASLSASTDYVKQAGISSAATIHRAFDAFCHRGEASSD